MSALVRATLESESVSVSSDTDWPPMLSDSSSSGSFLYSSSRASASLPEFVLSQLSRT